MSSTTARAAGFIAIIRRAAATIDAGFCKLTRIQWQAPWKVETPTRC
jgi:hypothetical protein